MVRLAFLCSKICTVSGIFALSDPDHTARWAFSRKAKPRRVFFV